ncbi:Desi1 [Symbiodinium sp. CCMP2592]|nr:Desi1 [Symbiodinium sp. CCMP2592]
MAPVPDSLIAFLEAVVSVPPLNETVSEQKVPSVEDFLSEEKVLSVDEFLSATEVPSPEDFIFGGQAAVSAEAAPVPSTQQVPAVAEKYPIYLCMYDISHGSAARWSKIILGTELKAIWHTGLEVVWPDRACEFWFGQHFRESQPGQEA